MTPTLTLDPYRFSTDPTAMTAFLEALGMAREVSSAEGRFVHLVAGRLRRGAPHRCGPA